MSRYRPLLELFQQAVATRIQHEDMLRQAQSGSTDPQEQQLRDTLARQEQQRDQEILQAQQDYQSTRAELIGAIDSELTELEIRHRQSTQSIERKASEALQDFQRKRQDSEWIVSSVMDDDAEDSPLREFERFKSSLLKSRDEQVAEWSSLEADFQAICERTGLTPPVPEEPEQKPAGREAAAELFSKSTESARQALRRFHSLKLPKLFEGFRACLLILVLALGTGLPAWLLLKPEEMGIRELPSTSPNWPVQSLGGGLLISLFLTAILYAIASSQRWRAFQNLHQLKAEAGWYHQKWLGFSRDDLACLQEECEQKHRLLSRQRRETLQRYEETHATKTREVTEERDRLLAEEQARYSLEYASLKSSRDEGLQVLDTEYAQRSQLLQRKWSADLEALSQSLKQYLSDRQRKQAELWSSTKTHWEQACSQLNREVAESTRQSRQTAPEWGQLGEGQWNPPGSIPSRIRLGDYDLNLERWEGAISTDMRLAPRSTRLNLPAELSFPDEASLLLSYRHPSGREASIRVLQSVMLRLLTLLPPGKLRFTLIDPVGLGESFAGFMHLADFDELLVTNRIWTEPGQIESRLADLTEHMENVLQKYLRNEFSSIEEYNQSAGEVAEPYHFLVLTDFPNKFSEIAARRLNSIVQSGPRCGVYTLMSWDMTKTLPNNFDPVSLTSHMQVLEWHQASSSEKAGPAQATSKDRFLGLDAADPHSLDMALSDTPGLVYPETAFYSSEPELQLLPLNPDAPPPAETFVQIVRTVGEASKDARRVEVAFDRITPKPDRLWSGDSRSELEIPLGRAGATKLQMLKLGRGTSQHMLIAGKTGSGKSTFLHILITNLALYYSPDEVSFFLIDFKKGVEFKDYATFQLPHAKVIAIESDREFGVSTLQKLDAVLQERGELFRRHGVQDLAGFRNQNPKQPLPRILLIVDEFQEFFIEDDRLSQSAALLLDRLVRQGRAFGIHVILGSQTLGGAYSLARSTLGQVAVRVALQCSEADAHLILSEENTAARLLTRPGEAIYNDANGLVEGNHPFQIAWLPDELRERFLKQIQQLALRRRLDVEPAIVFEGNIPSDLRRNPSLRKLASEYASRTDPVPAPTIWLGDAVEIKSGTTLQFHRQTGNNLLLVGADAEAAQGVMAAALIAAASQRAASQPCSSLYLLDGSPADSLEFAHWKAIGSSLPGDVVHAPPRQAVEILHQLTEELKNREANPETRYAPLFLFVFHLSKFRDLRKPEDDFGMGSFGGASAKPAEPGKLFADLLGRGPELGIHTIVWCDSYNNVDRWFSRQTLKDLEQRIAFQMNSADSSNLIDSPQASRLGTHRALLYREETGTCEKFRPYGLPAREWLDELRQLMINTGDPDIAASLEEFSIL